MALTDYDDRNFITRLLYKDMYWLFFLAISPLFDILYKLRFDNFLLNEDDDDVSYRIVGLSCSLIKVSHDDKCLSYIRHTAILGRERWPLGAYLRRENKIDLHRPWHATAYKSPSLNPVDYAVRNASQ